MIVNANWGNAYNATILIQNSGDAPIDAWQLRWAFERGHAIESSWGFDVVRNGSKLYANSLEWNSAIAPGETITVGFVVSTATEYGDAPAITCVPRSR